MGRNRQPVFTTLKSEGALLPADFLQKLAEGQKGIEGLTPEAYHLAGGEKLNEATSRSWNRLLGTWTAFQAASKDLKDTDPGTGITREKWLLPLFQELGYGRLLAAKSFEIDGKPYPISHLWQHAPIHLVGRNVELDKRSPGVAGAAKTTPHGLVQEFLNRSEGHLWGLLSNGLKLRILRDNKSLTRQAYVEFDLGGMMDGQVYSDFALLWLVCHQSRVEAERAEECWLEKWTETARQQGTRALDDLRDGVQRAIEALGRGFLAHSANKNLIEKLRKGVFDKQDYYRQLLRTVYRLIFLFVAEDRDLLLIAPPGSKERERYLRHYSVQHLRTLAEHRGGSPHADLWHALRLVFAKLSSETGSPELGLPALGSFLWSDKATPDLDRCELANSDLLAAVRSLALTIEAKVRRAIDYRNLGAEELGSVYESLLELHPDVNADAPTFDLKVAAGHERKTTGSYYTPTSLIECLLDSALEPVLQEAAKKPDPEKAILDLKVCDPACGSGHFLIAAAHRMANRLAAIRTGDEEPSPQAVRKALRDIVGRCLYGVDINPMAVELCKVNLWLEALEPGKPLSFLEHHIQCGNSLLGATPALLEKGIPDGAFEPLEGDDKAICRIFKKKNKAEREGGQTSLLEAMHESLDRLDELATAVADLDAIPDDTPEGQRAKQKRWEDLVQSRSYELGRLRADAWCAAFVWKKAEDPNLPYPITEAVFRRIERTPLSVPDWMCKEVRRLSDEYQFFHWDLAFPTLALSSEEVVGTQAQRSARFDLVLGNPPWERLQLEEKQFFASVRPAIAGAGAQKRKTLIRELEQSDPTLHDRYHDTLRRSTAQAHLIRSGGRLPLTGTGNLAAQALFVELAAEIGSAVGIIVPRGLANQESQNPLYRSLLESGRLRAVIDFENRRGLFPGTHRQFWFCLVVLGPFRTDTMTRFAFFLEAADDLRDGTRVFQMDVPMLRKLSPNTLSPPMLRQQKDAQLLGRLYAQTEILKPADAAGSWGWHSWQMLNETHEADELRPWPGTIADNLDRLYEAKLVHQFDHRYASYVDDEVVSCSDQQKASPEFLVKTRFVVRSSIWNERVAPRNQGRGWVLAFRLVTNASNERTMIATVLPRCAGTVPIPFAVSSQPPQAQAFLLANLNSFALDFVCRLRVSGTSLNHYILHQLPVLPPSVCGAPVPWVPHMSVSEWVVPRVLALAYTSMDLCPFARDLGYEGLPSPWDPDRRFEFRCELDAAFFHLYGVTREDVEYIMDTFPIVKASDEKAFGEYRTKRLIVDIYDCMQASVSGSGPYSGVLDPTSAVSQVANKPTAATS